MATDADARDERAARLALWGKSVLQQKGRREMAAAPVLPLSGDASFRRYFRLLLPDTSYLLVDAPPPREDCHPFVRIARRLQDGGLAAPRIEAADFEQGFMLLEDFGDALYLQRLLQARDEGDRACVDRLYQRAMHCLHQMQTLAVDELPPYGQLLLEQELRLFDHWFCEQYLQMSLSTAEQQMLAELYGLLIARAKAQPQVFVHRDYHSRNLMLRRSDDAGAPGIIDFQDAVLGADTYDLVSLLRDCYVVWSPQDVQRWALAFASGLPPARQRSDAEFLRDFDLMGLQRHLKVIGIFARLCLRDGKAGYLADIPAAARYVRQVCAAYEELAAFSAWFETRLVPLACARLPGARPA